MNKITESQQKLFLKSALLFLRRGGFPMEGETVSFNYSDEFDIVCSVNSDILSVTAKKRNEDFCFKLL